MNILIIENVWIKGGKLNPFQKFLLSTFSILPTLYARQLAAITPKKHTVSVLNERFSEINFNKKYDIVNINFTTSTAPRAYEIADTFQQKGVTVVLSGLHPSALPEEAKQHADSVLLGRGEIGWLQLLEDYEQNRLKNFYYPIHPENSNQCIPPTNINLDVFTITGAVEATRGCPYQCEFCPESNVPGGSQFYQRPVDEVVNEIKNIPQKTIMFYDASLTINPDYTKKLFRKMQGLNKKFFCNGNTDVLANDKELVKLSKQAGCVSWLIGFESVSQETLDKIEKKTNKVQEYHKAVENIHQNNMAVVGCFMFGFDTDTPKVFDETMKLIRRLEIEAADFTIVTPFPGTPLYKKLEEEGRILTKDWGKYTMRDVVFEPQNMSKEELLQGITKMYQEFYSFPYTIQRVAKSCNLGFYPFLLTGARNLVGNMSRMLLKNAQD